MAIYRTQRKKIAEAVAEKIKKIDGNHPHNEEDSQEELALLLEDIEKIIDENDALVYDDSVNPKESTTSMTIETLTTDEGVVQPLGIGEMSIIVRY